MSGRESAGEPGGGGGEEEQLTHSRAAAHPTEQAERVLERGLLSPVVWTVDGQAQCSGQRLREPNHTHSLVAAHLFRSRGGVSSQLGAQDSSPGTAASHPCRVGAWLHQMRFSFRQQPRLHSAARQDTCHPRPAEAAWNGPSEPPVPLPNDITKS